MQRVEVTVFLERKAPSGSKTTYIVLCWLVKHDWIFHKKKFIIDIESGYQIFIERKKKQKR